MNNYLGGDTGAGFMDTSFSSTSAGPRRPMGEQTLRAVTLKQLANVNIPQDNVFRIDNVDLTQCTFVAVIRNIQEHSTNVVYMMEDGTGVAEVRKWIDQNEGNEEIQRRRELTEDSYVRVFGRLNSFNGKVTVVAHKIRPVTNFNEISYHFLEAIMTHLAFTKKPSSADGDVVMTDSSNFTAQSASASFGGGSLHKRVMDVIMQYHEYEDGASIDQIVHQLQDVPQDKVRDTIEYLINEGHCYNTTDDNHVKSTEAL